MKRLVLIVIAVAVSSQLAWSSPSSPTALRESDVVSIAVSPNVQPAPGKIKLKLVVTSHQDNIQFCVGYRYSDEPDELTLRRSCQQLNGIYSPKVFWFEYKGLSAGEYQAFVEIVRVPSRLAGTAKANFTISSN